ncbi:MAG: fibronectin type III domain-containing protein [Gilvibacter sp.]
MTLNLSHELLFKKVLVLFLVITMAGFNSCKSDDGMPDNTDEQVVGSDDDETALDFPADFEIIIGDITHDSAVITWSSATTENTGEILYSVFLNDDLVAANLEVTTYTLNDLTYNTSYTLKISAKNSLGESLQISQFETPYPVGSALLLEKLQTSEVEYYTFEYNENNQIIAMNSEEVNPFFNLESEYEYNDDGNIRNIELDGVWFWDNSRFFYTEGEIFEIKNHRNEGDALSWITHTVTSETTMDYELLNCPYMCETILATVNVLFDSENRLTYYEWTNIDDPTDTFFYFFEYTNGNLTKVTDQAANVWEFTFDIMNSFLTYSSYYQEDYLEYSGFLFSLKNNLHQKLRLVPFINSFTNNNNPLTFIFNGEVYRTIEYTYNSLNYPTEIIQTDEGVEQPPIFLSYQLAL